MFQLIRPMANLAMLPVFLPMLVAAVPAPDPLITPGPSLEKRANGANIIGYSLSGTSWHTRSCNNGFFSTAGGLGNCCADSSCDFITACAAGTLFYDSGTSAVCSSVVCGTGYVFSTIGDTSPLHVYNCQSDWTVTETTTTAAASATQSVVTTTAQGSTVTVPNTANNVQSTAQGTSATSATSAQSSDRSVTLTVTNASGNTVTSVSVAGATSSGTSTANADSSSSNKGSNESSHSNAGAIAGGVVGGIAVLAIIAGVVAFLLYKRKKNNNAAPAVVPAAPVDQQPPQTQYAPPPMQENAAAWQQNNNYGYGQVPPHQQGGYPTQDYKMPMAGGGYANSPPPPQQGPHMMASPQGPQEMYSGPVQAPVELPSQGYPQGR